MDLEARASEISEFLGMDNEQVKQYLSQGFGAMHTAVGNDFREANPQNDDELLAWYRNTTAYIFELTAYHLDAGFNYSGMMEGVGNHLVTNEKNRVLVLGDGIGDLTIHLANRGLSPIYNDLNDSMTAKFAQFRFTKNTNKTIPAQLTDGWIPKFRANSVDAIVALDFFEHLTEVELWVRECYKALRPGGLFQAQNAFAIGDDEHGGSIPMHLTRNNRFEFDWDPLLEEVGFINMNNGWRLKQDTNA